MSPAPEPGAPAPWRAARRDLAIAVAAGGTIGLFVNLLHLVVPFFMLQVYDRVVPARSLDTLAVLVALTAAALAFLAVLDLVRQRVFAVLAERLARRLGPPALAAAVEAGLGRAAPAAPSPGGALRDLGELRRFVAGGPVTLPLDLAVAPLFLVVLWLLHPAYGLVGVVAAAILGVIGVAVELLARRPAGAASAAGAEAQAETASALKNAEVIAAMGMLPAVVRRWQRAQARARAEAGAGQALAGAAAALAKAVRMGLQIAMLATGAVLVIEHAVSPGSISAATVIMGRLLFPFEQMIEGWRQWCGLLAATGRLKALLAAGAVLRSAVPAAAERGGLVVEALGFVPPGADRAVLRNVGFTLEPGEALGVVGPSGAGKSTLARLIVGLWRPTAGGVYLDGRDTFAWERASFGRAVGYLPQSPALLDATVRENIARLADADPAEVAAAARAAGVHELIGRLPQGYETRIGEGGWLLSGGQRQRIALARALFGRPRLLVLDEPNASLDAEGEQAFLRAVGAAKAAGATVVIVAQRLSVLAVADRLLVLQDGTVARLGPRPEVMRGLAARAMAGAPRAAPAERPGAAAAAEADAAAAARPALAPARAAPRRIA